MLSRRWPALGEVLTHSEAALELIMAAGASWPEEAGVGFRQALAMACPGGSCRAGGDNCGARLLAAAYALALFKEVITVPAMSTPRDVLGKEAAGVVLDLLPHTAPLGLYPLRVYEPDVDTPENRLLKLVLAGGLRCAGESYMARRLREALELTWLSLISDVDEVKLEEVEARAPHLPPPYDLLTRLAGAPEAAAPGLERLHRLVELYVAALAASAIERRGGLRGVRATGRGAVVETDQGRVYYQADLGSIAQDLGCMPAQDLSCWVPDLVVSLPGGRLTVVEVKASDVEDYLMDGLRQARSYDYVLREALAGCGHSPTDLRTALLYYTTAEGINVADDECAKALGVEAGGLSMRVDDDMDRLSRLLWGP